MLLMARTVMVSCDFVWDPVCKPAGSTQTKLQGREIPAFFLANNVGTSAVWEKQNIKGFSIEVKSRTHIGIPSISIYIYVYTL